MRARRPFLAVLALLLAGCGSTGAPSGVLPDVDEAARDPYGGWIRVTMRKGMEPRLIQGELISVESDTLRVLPGTVHWASTRWSIAWSDSIVAVPWSAVEKVKAAGWQPETNGIALWGTLGALSTGSHGGFLIFSFPIWVISGIAGVHAENEAAVVEGSLREWKSAPTDPRGRNKPPPWEELRARARFPQGLPPGITRLRPRPPNLQPGASASPGRAP